jgi:multiple sugar transport system ATP-binding protein
MATIELEKVTKVYDNNYEAVHGLDLDVADGEFMVLVGPSGCGKTTALRMVAGLEDITTGTLRFGGKVVNDVSPKDRDVAMVFQNYALYPHMTVAENIGFALKLHHLSKEQIREKVADAAEILGLTPSLDKTPAQLSGGQRQRVAMGRAIVREPAVFLMDEPLSNLDAQLRVQMRAEVLRLQRRLGVATMYVTHDQTEAMTMGDRVAVLRSGYLEQCDTPQVLYDRPGTMFVAAFMGSPSMNLYDGGVTAGAGAVRVGGQVLDLPDRVRAEHPGLAAYAGRDVVVGLRAEHLLPYDGGDGPILAGTVELVEALGSELLVHFRLEARAVRPEGLTTTDIGARLAGSPETAEGVARVDPRSAVRAGEDVKFSVDVSRMQFFDPATGQAIWAQ